jgi:Amt family ammonium transporter|tara:strand:+ start:354 stop:1679 length:1326 start_codon:yes stop_codon:yes gene_type:complete
LVLFMTIPGLSAFYAGIVKRKNMLSVLMQCFSITCVMTLLWYGVGYSLCFSEMGNGVLGGLDKVFLQGITKASIWETIPEALWALYQMTFAIITPALMVGSFVERMKFSAVMWYSTLWMFAVYFPACHMVWGPGGAMAAAGVLDFAGGIVVHITAGIGALVGAMVLGPRKENKMVPGNLVLTVLGTGMLWVGWYGFNGGSALSAGADAAFACLATQIAAATAAMVWTAQDVLETGKASMLGIATGSIAGLATVTPCAGFVGPAGACVLGVAAGVVCRYFSLVLKEKFGYDDSLDVFGVHGVGGFVGKYFPFTTFRRLIAHTRLTFILFLSGTCLLGIVAAPALGGFNFSTSVGQQTVIQCVAAVGTAVYTAVASYVLLLLVKKIVGGDLRVPASAEQGEGLDQYCHGEQCYTLSHGELEGGQPVDVPGWNTAVTAPEPVAT